MTIIVANKWRRRARQALLAGLLIARLAMPATGAAASATVTWDPCIDPNTAGYYLYYGAASRQYTHSLWVEHTNTAVVEGLTAGTTYYFAATSLTLAGLESAYSAEAVCTITVSNPPPAPPVLLTHALLAPLEPFRWVVPPPDAGEWTFSLEAGAPAGASIGPLDGTFVWQPTCAQGSTTNEIFVRMQNEQRATTVLGRLVLVVQDALHLSLGATNVTVGQSARMPIGLVASAGLTNLTLQVNWDGQRLCHPVLVAAQPAVDCATIEECADHLRLRVASLDGQTLPGSCLLAWLDFEARPGQPSGYASLEVQTAQASKPDGEVYANYFSDGGAVTIVNPQPALRSDLGGATGRCLTVIALPGGTYEVQSATCLWPEAAWSPLFTYTQTNLVQSLELDATNPVIFFRLVQPSAAGQGNP